MYKIIPLKYYIIYQDSICQTFCVVAFLSSSLASHFIIVMPGRANVPLPATTQPPPIHSIQPPTSTPSSASAIPSAISHTRLFVRLSGTPSEISFYRSSQEWTRLYLCTYLHNPQYHPMKKVLLLFAPLTSTGGGRIVRRKRRTVSWFVYLYSLSPPSAPSRIRWRLVQKTRFNVDEDVLLFVSTACVRCWLFCHVSADTN